MSTKTDKPPILVLNPGQTADPSSLRSVSAQPVLGTKSPADGPVGFATVGQLIRERFPANDSIVGAVVLNQISDFYREIDLDTLKDAKVEPIELLSPIGLGIYRQTMCFVLAMAAYDIFPERKVIRVEHGFGTEETLIACYCMFADHTKLTHDEINQIDARMCEIINDNVPISQVVMQVDRARQFFERHGHKYAARYLESRAFPSVVKLNKCRDFMTLCHADRDRLVAPRTGILSIFHLIPFGNGLLLHFPTLVLPSPTTRDIQPRLEFRPFISNPMITAVFDKDRFGTEASSVESVGEVNSFIVDGKFRDLVQYCEALQDARIVDISRMIEQRESIRLVLVAGPSASGKRTFAAKLRVHLMACGLRPVMFSTDDYYRSPSEADFPKLPNGQPDFDDIQALRLGLLNDHLVRLVRGEAVEIPNFDKAGEQPEKGNLLKLGKRDILISDSIFSLHPDLTQLLHPQHKFLLFVAPMSQLNLDETHFVSNHLVRLARRLCRDFLQFDINPQRTLLLWTEVRRGEERNLFSFLNYADAVFNSSLHYELPLLKVLIEPLLEKVKPYAPEYELARQLMGLLRMFHPMPVMYVPSTSILREFIGCSDYK